MSPASVRRGGRFRFAEGGGKGQAHTRADYRQGFRHARRHQRHEVRAPHRRSEAVPAPPKRSPVRPLENSFAYAHKAADGPRFRAQTGVLSHSGSQRSQTAALDFNFSAKSLRRLVGVRGFEPPTPSSRTMCATRLRYTPTSRPIRPANRPYRGAGHAAQASRLRGASHLRQRGPAALLPRSIED
jgi:hypothetical protein